MNFNKKQLEAKNFGTGACSVIAPAGSGKTAVLIGRVQQLVDNGVNEKDILVVSFTNDTAKELNKKLHKNGLDDVFAGTFHSISRNMLFKNGINVSPKAIITDWQVENLFKTIGKFTKTQIAEIRSYIDYQKVYMKTYKDKFIYKKCSINEEDMRLYFKLYEEYKEKNKLYDFTDWLLMCYKIVKDKPCEYSYVLIDEHQDNNYIRNLLIKEWARHGNVFYVGDYRQSIYAFNGAIPEMFMNIDKEWDNLKIINMDINYRSCENIVYNANRFIKSYYGDYKHYSDMIANNKSNGKIEKHTYCLNIDEGKDIVDKIEKLTQSGEDVNDIAVLYRNNSNADYIENELKRRDIKYCISENKGFFDRKEVKLILSYLNIIDKPHDDEVFDKLFALRNTPIMYIKKNDYENIRRISGKDNKSFYETFISYSYQNKQNIQDVRDFKNRIEKLRLQKDNSEISLVKLIDNIIKVFEIKNYIEEKFDDEEIEIRKNSIEVLKSFAKGNSLKSFLHFVNNDNYKKNTDGIKLMTIHASKGLEFKHVFIISVEDGKFPSEKTDLIEEARLFYVAVTRAKENLHISQIGDENRFVDEYFNNNYIVGNN